MKALSRVTPEWLKPFGRPVARVLILAWRIVVLPRDAKITMAGSVVARVTGDKRTAMLCKLRLASIGYRHHNKTAYMLTRRTLDDIPRCNGKPKLAVFARHSAAHFLDPVLEALRRDYEIYRFYDDRGLVEQSKHFDVAWLEWGSSGYLLGRLDCPTVIRVHDWEITSDELMVSVPWHKADAIIFVNGEARYDFIAKCGQRAPVSA